MSGLPVEHFLDIYQTRLEMQEEGITNPPEEVKDFVRDLVAKLTSMPKEQELIIKDSAFYTLRNELVMKFPWHKDS